MGLGSTSVIQVTNIAPTVTNEQLRTLLSFVGTIREFVVYPTNDPSLQISRVCYVRYIDHMSVAVAQHLTNTVFIDRSILVKPFVDGNIPDESLALKLANEDHSQNSSNSGVVSQIATANGIQSITTIDPRLNALGLPQYPPLPANMDPSKIEEIRRTITVNNVSQFTSPEDLLEFFTQFGEVKYLRMTSNECDIIKSALIEFTDQSSVANALQNTGVTFNGSQLNISHSTTNILKSQSKSNDPEKFHEMRNDTTIVKKTKEPSRSPSRKRSRSISRRRSRERRRSVSRSKSRDRRRRSRSRDRRVSPIVSKDRSRERSKRDRPRERGWERSRDRSIERDRDRRRSRDRDRRRDRSLERNRDRDRNRERSRGRDSERAREMDRKERHRSKRDKERPRSRSRSKSKLSSKDKREILEFPLSKGDMDVCMDDKRIIDAETSSIKSERSSSHQKSLSPQLSSSRSKSYRKKELKLEKDYESEDEKYSI